MSNPRYKWWGYVKWVIRDYPAKCAELAAMRSANPQMDGMPHAHTASRTTENLALREFYGNKKREYEAVQKAGAVTEQYADGAERLDLIRLVFWDRTHTLHGAATACHISYATAKNWHNEFIRLVASCMNLLD